jgi:hypothetical protein
VQGTIMWPKGLMNGKWRMENGELKGRKLSMEK